MGLLLCDVQLQWKASKQKSGKPITNLNEVQGHTYCREQQHLEKGSMCIMLLVPSASQFSFVPLLLEHVVLCIQCVLKVEELPSTVTAAPSLQIELFLSDGFLSQAQDL